MIELIHPEMANVSKAQIKAKLATTLKAKEENIAVYGLKTKFGGGRSTGFALVYDSADARKKFDSKMNLRRVSASLVNLSIGRIPREAQGRQKAEKGNQGKSQEGQRCCQGQGCCFRRKEEVRSLC